MPHVVRLIVGPSARLVLPLSAIGGAALLAYADIVARLAGRDPGRGRDRDPGCAVLPGHPAPGPDGVRGVIAPIVELDAVTVAYRERTVLHDITLSIAAGERVALVGPNGAGKSTLLSVATGLLRPAVGSVRLAGEPVEGLDRLEVARRLAVVPGRRQPARSRRGWRRSWRSAGCRTRTRSAGRGPPIGPPSRAAIERVGVGHLLGRDARELSLGERQLVLIALAVAQAAPVLVLDEPTVHLDLRHQVGAMELLVDLNERDGTTIVAVLHDLALAAHFFPRLVLLDGGRIVADGPPADVLSPDRIRDVFGVDPGFVRLPVEV